MSCRYHVRSPIDLILIAAACKRRSPGSAECPQCTSKFTCAVCPDPRSGVQPLLPRGRQEPSLPPCNFSTSVKPVVSPQQAVLSFASICWLSKLPSPAGTGCGTLPCFVCEGQGYVNTKVLLLSAPLWFILHCYATSCGDCSLGVQAGPSSLAGLAVMHATARSVSVLSAASLHALSFRQQQSASGSSNRPAGQQYSPACRASWRAPYVAALKVKHQTQTLKRGRLAGRPSSCQRCRLEIFCG